jgi:hypothetical protein
MNGEVDGQTVTWLGQLYGPTHAVQVQREPPPQNPQSQIPGDELVGIRRRATCLMSSMPMSPR